MTKAQIKGYNKYTEENFNYSLENVISVQFVKGTIIITRLLEDGTPAVNTYTASSLDGMVTIL